MKMWGRECGDQILTAANWPIVHSTGPGTMLNIFSLNYALPEIQETHRYYSDNLLVVELPGKLIVRVSLHTLFRYDDTPTQEFSYPESQTGPRQEICLKKHGSAFHLSSSLGSK